MKIKSKDELLVKSFVQTVSSATTFSKRYKKVCHLLEMRPKLTEEQWLRVWRGLYYCIWYSEMTKGCDIMAQRIGTHDDLSMLFAGFKAITNDWFGIDVFRLDKYMYLVRIMTNTCIKVQTNQLMDITSQSSESKETNVDSIDSTDDNSKSDDNNESTKESVVKEEQQNTNDINETKESPNVKKIKSKKKFGKRKDNSKKEIEFDIEFRAKIIDNILLIVKASIGLTLHITDIFIDEITKVGTELGTKLKADQKIELYFNILLPFVRLLAITEDHRVLNAVKHNIFDKFKREVLISESIDTRKQVLQRLIDAMIIIGGNESIGRRNRDSIYDIIGIFKIKLNQLNITNAKSLKRKKILIGRGRHKRVKYILTSSSPFVTSIVPIVVV